MKSWAGSLVLLPMVWFVASVTGGEVELKPSSEPTVAEIKTRGAKLLAKGFKSSWSPDGKRIVFGRGEAGTSRDSAGGIAVLDVETGKTVQLAKPGKDPAWSLGDGRLIAYVGGGYGLAEEIWVVAATGGEPRKVADGGFPTWSADGKRLFFHSRKLGKLMSVRVDAEKPEPKEILNTTWWYPAISPDDKRVAYRSGSQLLVADLETARIVKTWRLPVSGSGFLAGWSPDGKQIGFGGYGGRDTAGLWILNVETGKVLRLSAGPFTMPDWSRDGAKIAFDLRIPQGNEIWTIETKALPGLQPASLAAVDRYAVPAGGAEDLLKFIENLDQFRPQADWETAEHRRRAPGARTAAAKRILAIENDEWSKPYQAALRVLLGDRVRTIGRSSPIGRQQTLGYIKTFLTTKAEKGLQPPDVELAISAGWALESAGNHELAAEAYRDFAGRIAESKDEKLVEMRKLLEGAGRRLALLGKEMKLEGTTTDGAEFDWSAYRGKVVLVGFWAGESDPCLLERRRVKSLYQRYHGRGFDVVGVSTDRDHRALTKTLNEEQLPWVTLHETDAGASQPMATYYGVTGTPLLLLVDKEGKVVSLRAGGGELDKLLQQLLGPPPELPKMAKPAVRDTAARGIVGFDSLGPKALRRARLRTDRINGSDDRSNQLPSGTVLAAKTNEGRFAKIRIDQYGYNLVLTWVTYDENGQVHSPGNGQTLRGTWTFDLDTGKEAGDGSDMWWEQVDGVKRYLVPRNGAHLALITTAGEQPKHETER